MFLQRVQFKKMMPHVLRFCTNYNFYLCVLRFVDQSFPYVDFSAPRLAIFMCVADYMYTFQCIQYIQLVVCRVVGLFHTVPATRGAELTSLNSEVNF